MTPGSSNQEEREELDKILEALTFREVTRSQIRRLNELLCHDRAARHAYLEAMSFEAALAMEFPMERGEVVRMPANRPKWLWGGLAAACVIALAVLMTTPWSSNQPGSVAGEKPMLEESAGARVEELDPPVLAVTRISDGKLSFEGERVEERMQISQGKVVLNGGSAELTFHSGAVMHLEDHTELVVESAYRVYVMRGRAIVKVPDQAFGFVVYTPTSFIQDFGTMFSVEVLSGDETLVHALGSPVEVSPSSRRGMGEMQVVKAQSGVRLVGGRMEEIPFSQSTVDFEQEKGDLPNHVHWSLDEWSGSESLAEDGVHHLKFTEFGVPVQPHVAPGKVGQGLYFDGRGHFASSNFPGIGGAEARSIVFWARIQPGATHDTPNGMVSWGGVTSSRKWQVAWNADGTRGELGALRVEFGNGHVIGSTDLRDGRWHHVAVVFLGGADADVSTHVRMYVDGVLEKLSRRKQNLIDTATGSAGAEPLTLGKYLGPTWKGRAPFYFEGELDEIYVFDGVLMPSDIVRLMERGDL